MTMEENGKPNHLPARPNAAPPARAQAPAGGLAPVAQQALAEGVDVVRAILVRWWIVVICAILALGAGIGYLWRAVPIYQSTSKIYIEQNPAEMVSGLYSNQRLDPYYDSYARNSFLEEQAEFIRSTKIIAAAAEKPAIQSLPSLLALNEVSEVPISAVQLLKAMVSAVVPEDGGTIVVSARSTLPQDAATVVNAVVEAYLDDVNARKRSDSAKQLSMLLEERKKAEADLLQVQQTILEFHRTHKSIGVAGEENPQTKRLAELAKELSEASRKAFDAELALKSFDEAAADVTLKRRIMAEDKLFDLSASFDEIDRHLITEHQVLIADQVQMLASGIGPGHPAMIRNQKKINELEYQLDRRGIRLTDEDVQAIYRKTLEGRASDARRVVEALTVEHDQQRDLAVETRTLAVEYDQMAKRSDRLESQLETIESRVKELSLVEDSDAIRATILEPAIAWPFPVSPNRTRTLAASLILGLMLGCGIAYLLEWRDERLRTPDEIVNLSRSPLLGVVPHVEEAQSDCPARETELHPHSPIAEAFRTIRTAIAFNAMNDSGRIIHVTSPSPGDGKSFVSSNLAIAFAQAGIKVLLIDADCRKPTLHHLFDLKGDSGLSSVLMGTKNLNKVVRPSSDPMLHLLPCGPVPSNPAELLNGTQFTKLLAVLSSHYQRIIIDSPPILPVTDSRIIAARSDSTILVLRAERSTRRMVRYSADALHGVGANLIGCVLNDIPRSRSGYGYYSRYSYSYGYGYGGYGGSSSRTGGAKPAAKPELQPQPQLQHEPIQFGSTDS